MKIAFEMVGGPWDGRTPTVDTSAVEPDGQLPYAWWTLTLNGKAGRSFMAPSPARLDILYTDGADAADQSGLPATKYRVTGQSAMDDGILVRAIYVGTA